MTVDREFLDAVSVSAAVLLLALAGWIVNRTLRGRASARHLVSSCTLAGCLILPFLSLALSKRGHILIPISVASPAVPTEPVAIEATNVADLSPSAQPIQMPVTTVPQVLFTVYICGLLVGLLRLATGTSRVSQVLKRSRQLENFEADQWALAGVDADAPRPFVSMKCNESVVAPFTANPVQPCLVLPTQIEETFEPVSLRQLFAHESAHVQGKHLWTGLIGRLATIALWPIPFVHLLARDLSQSQEEVCDNAALTVGPASDYARLLLQFSTATSQHPLGLGCGFMNTPSSLKSRINEILDPRKRTHTTMNKPTQAALVCGVAASLVLLAGTRLVYAQDPGTAQIVEVQQTSAKAGRTVTIQDVAPAGAAVAIRDEEDVRLQNRLARLDRKRERLLTRARATRTRYSVRADRPARPASGIVNGQAKAPSMISDQGIVLDRLARRQAERATTTISDDGRANLRGARAGREIEIARGAQLPVQGVPSSNDVQEARVVDVQKAQPPRVLSTGNRVEYAVPAQLAAPRTDGRPVTVTTRSGQSARIAPRSPVAETTTAMPAMAPMASSPKTWSVSSFPKVPSAMTPKPKTVIKQATVLIYEDGSTVIVGGTVQDPNKVKSSVKKPSTKRTVKPKK